MELQMETVSERACVTLPHHPQADREPMNAATISPRRAPRPSIKAEDRAQMVVASFRAPFARRRVAPGCAGRQARRWPACSSSFCLREYQLLPSNRKCISIEYPELGQTDRGTLLYLSLLKC